MSDDIVTRLRKEQRYQADRLGEEDSDDIAELARLAADEIERLQRELAKAHGAWQAEYIARMRLERPGDKITAPSPTPAAS